MQDIFVLTIDDIVKKYKTESAEIGIGRWISDDKYETALSDGAVTYDVVVIEKGSWRVIVLPIPEDASVVTAWNPDGYWIAYNNGPGWIGVEDEAQIIYKQWRADGKKTSLFVYNLATKQKVTLATVDDPGWSFKTKWISTTTLEYYLPPGEKKTYIISR